MNKFTLFLRNKRSALNKILDFVYFAIIFLILYWIFVLLLKLVCNKAKMAWEMECGILESSLWTRTYSLAPLISFIIASVVSGVIQASYRTKRFLWARALIFIVVFWFIDRCVLSSESSFWDFYPTSEHEFTAPVLAIGCTILIIRRMAGSCNRIFLKATGGEIRESLAGKNKN